ncbi:MAG: hypothetical protein ACI8U4_000475 [Natronomonas sp.]|jgi:hypothetical protein
MSQYVCSECGLLERSEVSSVEGLSAECDHCDGYASYAHGRR